MKRSKESHELPQGLTPRPYQPSSSTGLFIALNRGPTIRGRAIVPPRTPLSPYLSLTALDRYAAPLPRHNLRDIKSGPNYCRVIAQFGANAALIRRQHLQGEIRRIVKRKREERERRTHAIESCGGVGKKLLSIAHIRFQMRTRVKYCCIPERDLISPAVIIKME